jgi:hypothetical protein
MSQSKAPFALVGAAAGLAVGTALIGLLLMGIATAFALQANTASILSQHPLFVPGSELIYTSLIAGLPLFAIWYVGRKKSPSAARLCTPTESGAQDR